jgi:hypothetical protein
MASRDAHRLLFMSGMSDMSGAAVFLSAPHTLTKLKYWIQFQ